ncbi:hypothetical protein DQQ10_07735 [Pseudochryseolinea flava]|uniref:PRC-barrel domain-containing protein n=1 Tax=Pseudochryseolinea flava TaxID=2059302 RepID=A0A364Y3P9_9BACT|nr:hypothetical protein DQQ10_07735 [Pseudochryseolinea flava]
MVRTLAGFLTNYSVISKDGSRLGIVTSCLLDVELGMITHLALNVHDHQVALPFQNFMIDHRLKEVRLSFMK